METVLGQELVEVEAADPPRDVRKSLSHARAMSMCEHPEALEQVGEVAAYRDRRRVRGVVVGTDIEHLTTVEH